MRDNPIGMFDSGLGGLTVMQEVVKALPMENIVYFGDTARLPYGSKSAETIIRYSIENSHFLLEKHVKMLVIPCNTASAHALETLQQRFGLPILGVIGPGAESAVQATKMGRIGVLATKGTIQSQSYQKAINQLDSKISLFPMACPLFVPLVEEGYVDHPVTHLITQEYLKPLLENKIDTLLLGCTHYPLLREVIQSIAGDKLKIVDSAVACAVEVEKVLRDAGLQRETQEASRYEFYVSDDPEKFRSLGARFLGRSIDNVSTLCLAHAVAKKEGSKAVSALKDTRFSRKQAIVSSKLESK